MSSRIREYLGKPNIKIAKWPSGFRRCQCSWRSPLFCYASSLPQFKRTIQHSPFQLFTKGHVSYRLGAFGVLMQNFISRVFGRYESELPVDLSLVQCPSVSTHASSPSNSSSRPSNSPPSSNVFERDTHLLPSCSQPTIPLSTQSAISASSACHGKRTRFSLFDYKSSGIGE